MRNALVLALLVVTTICAFGSKERSIDQLIEALIEVESHGNDYAIGDKHLKDKAYGCLQIRRSCLEDVNQLLGTKHRPEDMLGKRALSVKMCRTYLSRYATRKALGREPTIEDMARIWNGGPAGWRKKSTLPYWHKVQKVLNRKQSARRL